MLWRAKTRWCQPGGLGSGPEAIPEGGSLGQGPLRSGPSWRAGRPKPRLPASLARGCLHPEHPRQCQRTIWWPPAEPPRA
jgi:hypothetical protein